MDIQLCCPHCGTRLKEVPLMSVATLVVKRTCQRRSCQTRWQIKVTPLRRGDGYHIHRLDWVQTTPAQETADDSAPRPVAP